MTNEASKSFEILTFNKENDVLYFIDEVNSGLSIKAECTFPCKDCLSGNPNYCTSCFEDTKLPYLQEGTCVSSCSSGNYLDKFTCLDCDPNCLTCEGSAKSCKTCGILPFIHLKGQTCVEDCGQGFINDSKNHLCLPCREGCSSCSMSTTNCTSCDENSKTPFLFDFDCKEACPAEISVFQPPKCVACSLDCKTCADKVDQCTSCKSHMRLDTQDSVCVDACLPEIQIFDPVKVYCNDCDESCATCIDDVHTCSTCKPGLVLNDDRTCKAECTSDSGVIQTPVANVCVDC